MAQTIMTQPTRPCRPPRRTSIAGVTFFILLLTYFHGVVSPSKTWAQDTSAANDDIVRFEAVDIYVDSAAESLAAYQVELVADDGRVQIAGIEGGEHDAFREPPFYDPAALTMNRIVVAAFSTADELPSGKARIARIHVRVRGGAEFEYQIKLVTAAASDGSAISPELSVLKVTGANDATGDTQ